MAGKHRAGWSRRAGEKPEIPTTAQVKMWTPFVGPGAAARKPVLLQNSGKQWLTDNAAIRLSPGSFIFVTI